MANKFTLVNTRLSFANLYTRAVFEGKEGKYEATFLLHKEKQADQIAKINQMIDDALLEAFGSKDRIPKAIKSEKNCCLRDGDLSSYDGYAGHMSLKAANKNQPRLMDRAKAMVNEDSGLLYSGCYVDVSVQIWIQNNAYGKKANCNLLAVRHREHGEPFGGGGIPEDIEDEFEDLEEVVDAEDFDL